MVKLHCDRCGEEIKDKYYTINFWEYEANPKYDKSMSAIGCTTSYSNTRDDVLRLLNSQKMYCNKCKDEIENFIVRT